MFLLAHCSISGQIYENIAKMMIIAINALIVTKIMIKQKNDVHIIGEFFNSMTNGRCKGQMFGLHQLKISAKITVKKNKIIAICC